MTLAEIRFFCLVLPTKGPSLGFDYLQAFQRTGREILACAIGQGYLMAEPWNSLTHLFQGQTAPHFVNVACAPLNFLMGTRLARTPDGGLTPGATGDAVYEPATALSGLYTAGVPNIAITLPRGQPPEPSEIRALQKYDAVLCPTEGDSIALAAMGVVCMHLPPSPDQLGKLTDRLFGVFDALSDSSLPRASS